MKTNCDGKNQLGSDLSLSCSEVSSIYVAVIIFSSEQKIEDIFIESAIKNTKTLLIGEEVCDAAEPEEYWTTIRNIKDITSLDKLVTLGLADVAKFNEKFKFDLYFKPNEIRIDHIDSTKFDLKTHCKKIWGLGKKRVARPAGLVPARQPPATTEDRENIEETISKKARKSYAVICLKKKTTAIFFKVIFFLFFSFFLKQS